MKNTVLAIAFSVLAIQAAADTTLIPLPAPQTDGGRPLMQVLRDRKSSRAFSAQPLPKQVLSNLLWAAFGINRPETGGRTAPSALNKQEIDLYLAMADGLFLYNAKDNSLRQITTTDVRPLTGKQPFVAGAPLNLVYVADLSKTKAEDASTYAAVGAGAIAENVYLFCASSGLATVVRGSVDKPVLGKAMRLRADQAILLAQTVGYAGQPDKQ